MSEKINGTIIKRNIFSLTKKSISKNSCSTIFLSKLFINEPKGMQSLKNIAAAVCIEHKYADIRNLTLMMPLLQLKAVLPVRRHIIKTDYIGTITYIARTYVVINDEFIRRHHVFYDN